MVHGVVHRIRLDDWKRIKLSEGVIEGQSQGYYEANLPCTLYGREDREEMVATLLSNPSSHHRESVTKRPADSIVDPFSDFYSPEIINASLPSRRYKNLLVEGARYHGLDGRYQNWLEQLTAYEDASACNGMDLKSSNRAFASMNSLALAVGIVAPALALGTLMDLGGGFKEGEARSTPRMLSAATNALWDINDLLIEPLLGFRGK